MQKGTIITLNWLGIIILVVSYILALVAEGEGARFADYLFWFNIAALIIFIVNIRFTSKIKQ